MTDYPLHYIGRGIYTPGSFEAEAQKHGVARVIPKPILGRMKWGDPVLLAVWEPPPRGDGEAVNRREPGTAQIFGFFRISGFNVGAEPRARDVFWSHLHIVREEPGGGMVSRACGSYAITGIAFISDGIDNVVWAAQDAEQKTGQKVKLFATGAFIPIAPWLRLEDTPFARTLMTVSLRDYDPIVGSGELPDLEGDGRPLSFIRDYARRQYIKKADRSALGFQPEAIA